MLSTEVIAVGKITVVHKQRGCIKTAVIKETAALRRVNIIVYRAKEAVFIVRGNDISAVTAISINSNGSVSSVSATAIAAMFAAIAAIGN